MVGVLLKVGSCKSNPEMVVAAKAVRQKVDLWMKMTLCQQLADIHRGRTGKEGDDGTIPATVIEFTETGARKANH